MGAGISLGAFHVILWENGPWRDLAKISYVEAQKRRVENTSLRNLADSFSFSFCPVRRTFSEIPPAWLAAMVGSAQATIGSTWVPIVIAVMCAGDQFLSLFMFQNLLLIRIYLYSNIHFPMHMHKDYFLYMFHFLKHQKIEHKQGNNDERNNKPII